MAEREGFEPSVELPLRVLSKDVDLATLPSLLVCFLAKKITLVWCAVSDSNA
jgi:hypothetical protein